MLLHCFFGCMRDGPGAAGNNIMGVDGGTGSDSNEAQSHEAELEVMTCNLCKMLLNGPHQYQDHLNGHRHRKNVKKQLRADKLQVWAGPQGCQAGTRKVWDSESSGGENTKQADKHSQAASIVASQLEPSRPSPHLIPKPQPFWLEFICACAQLYRNGM